MTALLVTGSRSLARIDGAREWCEGIVRTHGDATIVTGDANGPDAWALAIARLWSRTSERWQLNGLVHYGGHPVRGPMRWCTHDEMRDARLRLGSRFPLYRNEAMVRSVAHHHSDALVLAFIDPASRTRGTEHTCRLAEAAGLRVERLTWGGER
jgi:hypothetical protein